MTSTRFAGNSQTGPTAWCSRPARSHPSAWPRDLDAITSNISGKNFTLYENLGDGSFGNPRTLAASGAGSCAIIHDRDNDGDLDITGVDEIDDLIVLFENRSG